MRGLSLLVSLAFPDSSPAWCGHIFLLTLASHLWRRFPRASRTPCAPGAGEMAQPEHLPSKCDRQVGGHGGQHIIPWKAETGDPQIKLVARLAISANSGFNGETPTQSIRWNQPPWSTQWLRRDLGQLGCFSWTHLKVSPSKGGFLGCGCSSDPRVFPWYTWSPGLKALGP